MEAIAHSPEFAKKAGVPQSVGKDYAAADKGKKFAVGGPSLAKVGKQNTRHGKMDMPFSQLNRFAGMKAGGLMDKGVEKKLPTSKQMGNLNMKAGGMKESKAMVGKEVDFMKKKGAPASMIKHEAAEMGAMKKGGMAKYMTFSDSGKPAGMKPVPKMARGGGIESRGKTKGTVIKMATGGVVKFARGGGIEAKGKTKGTMIKMKGC
jgi:hypothetical protein